MMSYFDGKLLTMLQLHCRGTATYKKRRLLNNLAAIADLQNVHEINEVDRYGHHSVLGLVN